MQLPEGYEVIESVAVEMDPVLDGFAGVLFELVFDGEQYMLTQSALGSGDRLLRFSSQDQGLVQMLFRAELTIAGGPSRAA
jgi:hypothetical protein